MHRILLILAISLFPATSHAASGNSVPLDHVQIDLSNKKSLQRGARVFVNFCLSCHSAAYMRYNRMSRDLEIPIEVLKKNLLFAGKQPGDLMITTMPHEAAKRWFGVTPPDLSLTARSRGPDWIYTYLRSFYLDPESPSGWNNTVFDNVAMPHALYEWQGSQRAVFRTETEIVDGVEEKRQVFDHFVLDRKAKLTTAEYDKEVKDLTNFMVYLAEPAKLVRYNIGYWTLLFLSLLAVMAYLLKKEFWKDIH